MSLEQAISTLNDSVNRLIAAMSVGAPAPVVQATPVPAQPAPVPQAQQYTPAPQAPVQQMPPPPFGGNAAASTPAAPVAPFTDAKGLIDYATASYYALGEQKGAGINTVMTQLGYQNITDIQPVHYGQFFAGVEALKAS